MVKTAVLCEGKKPTTCLQSGGKLFALRPINQCQPRHTHVHRLIPRRKSGQRGAVGGDMWSVRKGKTHPALRFLHLPPSVPSLSFSQQAVNIKESKRQSHGGQPSEEKCHSSLSSAVHTLFPPPPRLCCVREDYVR